MPNPTVAKPTTRFLEPTTTGGTVGANTLCFLGFPDSGLHRDAKSGQLAIPYTSWNGYGMGSAPVKQAGAFTPGGLTDPAYRFTAGTFAFRLLTRGLSTPFSGTKTLYGVVRPYFVANAQADLYQNWFGTGSKDAFGLSVGIRVTTAGVVTLGLRMSISFYSSTITSLTSGSWYLISCTLLSATQQLWNVYDFTGQAYVTTAGTGLTSTTSTITAPNDTDFTVNNLNANNVGCFDLYMAGATTDTLNPATNSYFADLVSDPFAPARASYTSTGTLAPNGMVLWDSSPTSVTFAINRANLGAAGNQDRYQFTVHESSTPWASDPASAATRVGALQSSPIVVHTGASATTPKFYVGEIYDGTSSVYTSSYTLTAGGETKQVSACLSKGPFVFMSIGDSRDSSNNRAQAIVTSMRAAGYRTGYYGRGLGSTAYYSGTASLSWQPNTTQDPTNGQAGTTLLANACTEIQQCGITTVVLSLGVNDNSADIPTFKLRVGYTLAVLLAAGVTRIYLLRPFLRQDQQAGYTSIQALGDAIASMANGTTIIDLGTGPFTTIQQFEMLTQAADALHLGNSQMERTEGTAIGIALLRILDSSFRGSGSSSGDLGMRALGHHGYERDVL